MFTKRSTRCRSTVLGSLLAMLVAFAPATRAQSLEWGATKYFKYNIENVVVSPTAGVAGSYDVKVIFSVTNPVTNSTWDIKTALPFQSPSASLTLDLGWDPATDVSNTGSENPALAAIVTTALGKGAALPVQARGLQSNGATGATPCAGELDCPGAISFVNRYRITKSVTPVAFTSVVTRGRVALEGRPVCNGVDAAYVCPASTGTSFVNIPVPSAVANFTLSPASATTALIADPRRAVVDIRKCQVCHDGNMHGDTVVPQLSLHGGNRTGNLSLCVICHNPNQTDVPYRYLTTGTTADPRISGAETPIDFKTMVHSIHAGGFRENPFVVVGFGSSVNDFSHVRFPSTLRNCLNCHVDVNGKGTFELPLAKAVSGTTVNTRSTYLVAPGASRTINVAPADDLKISPTAAVCSSCHDKAEVRSHMTTRGGASFATTQSAIGTRVVERCAICHGPGKAKDVRKVHEVDGSGGDD